MNETLLGGGGGGLNRGDLTPRGQSEVLQTYIIHCILIKNHSELTVVYLLVYKQKHCRVLYCSKVWAQYLFLFFNNHILYFLYTYYFLYSIIIKLCTSNYSATTFILLQIFSTSKIAVLLNDLFAIAVSTILMKINVSWASNQHIRMISEWSCDTEYWSNDCWKLCELCHHSNILHFKILN